jgi:hypothetical protein
MYYVAVQTAPESGRMNEQLSTRRGDNNSDQAKLNSTRSIAVDVLQSLASSDAAAIDIFFCGVRVVGMCHLEHPKRST